MRKYRLNEDRLPSKLPVRFSHKVFKTIKSIEKHNADNRQSLSNWFDYLNEVKAYISNRVIAWDYNSRHIRFPNGAFFIKDFDYNVGYTIKNNDQNQTYVYVFMMNLKTEEFGLKVPNVNESKRTISRKELKNIINECVDRCLKNYLVESIYEHRETLYRCYNEEICKTKWIWLSDFEDNTYGVNVATFSIPLNKLLIADYDTTLKYIQKYDIKSFQDAMYDEYIEMGMDMFDWKSYEDGKITDEQAYNQITRLSWTEVMEHPQDYTFAQHLEKDGFDGYCFNYMDMFQGCPMYYAFFNKNTILKYRIS